MTKKSVKAPQMKMDATSIPLGSGWKWEWQINLPASDSEIEEGEVSRD